ncbi:DUF4280 domain-containing protein [Jiangella sp. DSM 45060]|uniref:DUF4280 domain-containing protein n=1 Tax=Jiangella sp. DSM 45060 TaxID=1798224 RepID=UPI00087A90DC|nr:DUF4280 domain-containing protein [Jiangella sp. DSM 45060]SDS70409.1 protein of unknown function [Jiangella sp. DSM 45060]
MGDPQVVDSAQTSCSFGTAPASLGVLPTARVTVEGRPAATVADAVPFLNIRPFNTCVSLANPMVAAATSAAMGVLTPQPCIPATTAWLPGSPSTTIGGRQALTLATTCRCQWGGIITVAQPGSVQTTS